MPVVNEKEEPLSLTGLNQSGATLLNVTFKGKTPIKVKAVATTLGQIASVNANTLTMEIATQTGSVVTRSFQTTPTVMRDGVIVGTLSSVKAGDRVEVRMDENDRGIVEIIPGLDKKYLGNTADTLTVQRATLNENNVFSLHPKVYVHQGTRTLSLSEFKNGDALTIYILRGKVIEVSK